MNMHNLCTKSASDIMHLALYWIDKSMFMKQNLLYSQLKFNDSTKAVDLDDISPHTYIQEHMKGRCVHLE